MVVASTRRRLVRLALQNEEFQRELVSVLREARTENEIPEQLRNMRFRHPETNNRVKFVSLPSQMQTQLLAAYRKLQKDQEAAAKPRAPESDSKSPRKGRPDLPDAQKGGRTWTDRAPKWMRGRKETWEHHFDKDPRSGGRPSKKRQEFYDKIIDKALKDVPSKPPGEREAVFLMGGPGSGKSVARSSLKGDFVEIDADNIKNDFPEYKLATRPEKTYRKAAHMVHKESAHVSNQMLDRAMEEGKPFVFDRTGVSLRRMRDDMKRARKAGYKLRVVMVDVPKKVGRDRVRKRAESSGRYVPDFILDEAYSLVPGNFMDVMKHADEAQLVSGETGKSIYQRSGRDADPEIGDEEYWKRFRDRYTYKPRPSKKYKPIDWKKGPTKDLSSWWKKFPSKKQTKEAGGSPLEGFSEALRRHDRELASADRDLDVEKGMWVEFVDLE